MGIEENYGTREAIVPTSKLAHESCDLDFAGRAPSKIEKNLSAPTDLWICEGSCLPAHATYLKKIMYKLPNKGGKFRIKNSLLIDDLSAHAARISGSFK